MRSYSGEWDYRLELTVPKIIAFLQLTQAKMDKGVKGQTIAQPDVTEAEQEIVDEMVEEDALTLADTAHVCQLFHSFISLSTDAQSTNRSLC